MEIKTMEDLTSILSNITEAQTALSERLASIEQSLKDEQEQSDGEQEAQSDEKSDEEKEEEVNEVAKLLFK